MLKAIALDFDGVILESVDIKTRAFRELFKENPDHLDKIIQLHLENGGLSRFEKFDIIYRDFLRKILPATEKEQLVKRFSKLVFDEILTCPFVPGALDFLRAKSQCLPIFIVSGTPEEELREITAQLNLTPYCQGIFGSPRSKEEILQDLLSIGQWVGKELLFIGDALTDYNAAYAVGVPFVGRAQVKNPFPKTVFVVGDLYELARQWENAIAAMDRAH